MAIGPSGLVPWWRGRGTSPGSGNPLWAPRLMLGQAEGLKMDVDPSLSALPGGLSSSHPQTWVSLRPHKGPGTRTCGQGHLCSYLQPAGVLQPQGEMHLRGHQWPLSPMTVSAPHGSITNFCRQTPGVTLSEPSSSGGPWVRASPSWIAQGPGVRALELPCPRQEPLAVCGCRAPEMRVVWSECAH